ncbi:MAG: translation initiation factor IF-3 [Myxococcota bacterium]|nr:translation initiation factor IF-3 [Myxococcota bacterium]
MKGKRRLEQRLPDTGPRRNEQIRIREVLLIDHDGRRLGIVPTLDAKHRAAELGLDLVEVAPQARPPVCKIMDYGRYKYEQSKKASATKAEQQDIKTIRFRPKTDEHDLEIKLKTAAKFLGRGDKVRLVVRMRGRENAYPERWLERLNAVMERVDLPGKFAGKPSIQGRMITALLEPSQPAPSQRAPAKPELSDGENAPSE